MSSNGTENGHHPDLRHRSVPPGNDAVVRVGVNVVCPAGRFTLIPAQNTNPRQGENGREPWSSGRHRQPTAGQQAGDVAPRCRV